jgi:hypothetical protein
MAAPWRTDQSRGTAGGSTPMVVRLTALGASLHVAGPRSGRNVG